MTILNKSKKFYDTFDEQGKLLERRINPDKVFIDYSQRIYTESYIEKCKKPELMYN